MKIVLLLMVALLMAGCAEFNAAKTGIAAHGAQMADEEIALSKWQLCEQGHVGAIMREFDTPEKIKAYNTLCPLGKLPVPEKSP